MPVDANTETFITASEFIHKTYPKSDEAIRGVFDNLNEMLRDNTWSGNSAESVAGEYKRLVEYMNVVKNNFEEHAKFLKGSDEDHKDME